MSGKTVKGVDKTLNIRGSDRLVKQAIGSKMSNF